MPLTAPAAGELALPAGASGTAWADALVPEGAETLVGYEHPHLGRWAGGDHPRARRGRVTYVGTLPDRALAVALARWLRPTPDAWADRPDSVTVTGARNPAGGRLRFVSNWSWEPARLRVPVRGAGRAVRDGDRTRRDNSIWRPWDVRVLLEEARTETTRRGVHLEQFVARRRRALARAGGRRVPGAGRDRRRVRRQRLGRRQQQQQQRSSGKKVDMAAELKKPATITVWAWTPGTDKAVAMFEKAVPEHQGQAAERGPGPAALPQGAHRR